MKKYCILLLMLPCWLGEASAQVLPSKKAVAQEVVFKFNEEGSQYFKVTGLVQVWLRNTQMNPGTTISGYPTDSYSDISIRRLRFQVYGQLSERVFFYSQFGQNNFNFHSNKYEGAFFHDGLAEYAIHGQKLSLGAGLTAWSGLTRYASPSVGSILSLDAPLYQQATNGVNDQFLRKLSVYAKGQFGRLDYRLAVSQPMTITGAAISTTEPGSSAFAFSNEPARKQLQAYVKYMFWEKETNLTPYHTGSYMGKKKVLNLGGGVIHQPDAMWALGENGQNLRHDMTLWGADIFLDQPLAETAALTAYAAFTHYDFGTGYLRYLGVDNAGTGTTGAIPASFGDAFPMIGTGNTLYTQLGYLLGSNQLTPEGKLQPFASLQWSDYDKLSDPMTMYELGTNFLIHGNHSHKISLMYQSRPVYRMLNGEMQADGRKGMTVLQLQASF